MTKAEIVMFIIMSMQCNTLDLQKNGKQKRVI